MIDQGRVIHRSANHPALRAAPPVSTNSVTMVVGLHGLGDWVEAWARPIACWLDKRTERLSGRWAWAKTALCGCSACSRRRRVLNALVPDVRRWEGGWKVGCTRVATGLLRGLLGFVDRMF